jgi:hypothetical protein
LPPVDPRRIVPEAETLNKLPLPSLDLTKTFSLNSLPGANHTIYLDFNGHTTTGTLWNTAFGKSSIVTPTFDLDGSPASFSTTELERIQYIWQRVVEDFSPFNVNVTTQEPTLDRLIKSGTTDTAWGVRVAIGGSSYDWFGAGAGGVAYLNSFNWNSDTPTFVFTAQLGGVTKSLRLRPSAMKWVIPWDLVTTAEPLLRKRTTSATVLGKRAGLQLWELATIRI